MSSTYQTDITSKFKNKEEVLAGDKRADSDSYLSVPTPRRLAQNHPQILKKPYMTEGSPWWLFNATKTRNTKSLLKKKTSSCTSSWAGLVYIPVEGGDRLRRDASQKIKDRSTNKGAGSERPPFLPVISLALHNIVFVNVFQMESDLSEQHGPNSHDS